jgi:C4-dicarboxylate-specific signal transduction histidine kinase
LVALNRLSIRRQIGAAVALIVAAYAVAAVYSSFRTREERREDLRQQAQSVATTAAAHLDEYFGGLDAMASALAGNPAALAFERPALERFLADVLKDRPLLANLVLTTTDGRMLATGAPVPPELEHVTWAYIGEVARTDRPLVTNLVISPVSGRPVMMFAYPVHDAAGRVAAVLGVGLHLSELQHVFGRIPLPDGSIVTMTDGGGQILARNVDAAGSIGAKASLTPASGAGAVPPISVGPDGVERISGRASVERGPWLLSVGIPTEVAVARQMRQARRISTLAIAMLAIALGALLPLAHRTAGSLGRLRGAAQRIAAGDLSPPSVSAMPNLELGQLQDAFVSMAASLREARDALGRQMEHDRQMNETLQSLQRQVVRQERLAAVGLLVSGVAHELNNPLQAILGTVELLERRPGVLPEVLHDVGFVKTQTGRARDIIRNLSRFSSQQIGPPTSVDLSAVVDEVVQLRRRELESLGISLDLEIATSRTVSTSFTEIEQVILNFVINAQQSLEATPAVTGRIRIGVKDAGPHVRLEVLDNGRGVDPADEPKLFQPFFTTKPVGHGTGLGLSVSYGIIDSYGGTIGYLRNDWGGATFYFELPAEGVVSALDGVSAA